MADVLISHDFIVLRLGSFGETCFLDVLWNAETKNVSGCIAFSWNDNTSGVHCSTNALIRSKVCIITRWACFNTSSVKSDVLTILVKEVVCFWNILSCRGETANVSIGVNTSNECLGVTLDESNYRNGNHTKDEENEYDAENEVSHLPLATSNVATGYLRVLTETKTGNGTRMLISLSLHLVHLSFLAILVKRLVQILLICGLHFYLKINKIFEFIQINSKMRVHLIICQLLI